MPATLALHFSHERGCTSMRVLEQQPPWRALRAFLNSSGEALVHLHNVSGGVLGGDNLKLEVTLAAQARAQITNVGATRIYRHRPGRPDANQHTIFHVGPGALLEYLPDPVIPFAASRFSQATQIHLSADAGVIWWETLSPGRAAHGESFTFDSFFVETAIHSESGPLALERYCLSPGQQAVGSPARMGPFQYSATMYVCRASASLRWLELERELNAQAQELSGPETCWGASSLVRHGIVLRGMARHAHQISQGLQSLWQAAKQSVWGRDALLPRKIY
jgi:urease accessory protein